jgi:hypothetical protein
MARIDLEPTARVITTTSVGAIPINDRRLVFPVQTFWAIQ